MRFLKYDLNGKITALGYCAEVDYPLQDGYPDFLLKISDSEVVDLDTHFVSGGEIIKCPIKTSINHYFDVYKCEWIADNTREWVDVREIRNARLFESDWTDTASAPMRLGEKLYSKWQNYRQALRDVTNQPDPFNIVWPTKPE